MKFFFSRDEIGRAVKRHLERRALKKLNQNPTIAEVLAKARPAGPKNYNPNVTTGVDYTDDLTLYNWIKKNKPQEILECGRGVTTSIMAQALLENGGGRITALEDSEEFFEKGKENIHPTVRHLVDYRLTKRITKRYGPFVGVGYEGIPDRPYDFVFIDGPNYDRTAEYDADIFEIVAKSNKPVSAMIDTRTGSCFIYHLVFGDKFRYDYLGRFGFIDGATKDDMRDYLSIISHSMKRREWRRWL